MRIYLRRPDPDLACDLETPRFELRCLRPLEAIRDPGNWRSNAYILGSIYYLKAPLPLLRWLRSGPIPNGIDRFLYAIVPKGADTPIGYHGIKFKGYRSAMNMVGIHDESWWGKDVVVEVRARLMNHIYRNSEIERFTGRVDSRNRGSLFTYRKLGYDHVGTDHRDMFDRLTGDVVDFFHFEMFKDKWQRGPYAENDL